MRPFTPLAVMVMRGSDPHLLSELRGSKKLPGFPDPDLADHFPMRFCLPHKTGLCGLAAVALTDHAAFAGAGAR
jgi:hypothetical protein